MSHSKSEASSASPEELISNIQKLMDEVEELVHAPAESGHRDVSSRLSDLQDRLADMTDRAKGAYKKARRTVINGAKRADETIREHPYPSLAVALGLGLLVGVLLRRRED